MASSSTTPLPLQGKIALVTGGGTRGIGADTVIELVKAGASVAIGYRSSANLAEEVQANCKPHLAQGAQAWIVQGDISDASSAQTFAKAALDLVGGKIDILVQCAGYMYMHGIHELKEDSWNAHLGANVTGPLFLTQALLPNIRDDGKIILFSSTLTTNLANFAPGYLSYLASKGALEQVARMLARDPSISGAERRITTNVVAPGPVATELFLRGKSQEVIDRIASSAPAKRLGKTEEIGSVVAFLASPAAAWVNGQTLRVNGGLMV
ncbi:short-chain dehydrogenase/reductase SDR [Ceraceosorus guamensis]|uniref:Short-chain dehydrogenase/reductase SDR n=1 Tax=Ceraceosorus guamensis TaxID=1522189 RepID=A0A316VWV6_9BASI|nr:short-chain dehydrogenase/reductase SDR [Ceraceosorus guamensis]PWN40761.1 short-chain dehydrogenase/reductase SDR [Ceraceosorus guamensis]